MSILLLTILVWISPQMPKDSTEITIVHKKKRQGCIGTEFSEGRQSILFWKGWLGFVPVVDLKAEQKLWCGIFNNIHIRIEWKRNCIQNLQQWTAKQWFHHATCGVAWWKLQFGRLKPLFFFITHHGWMNATTQFNVLPQGLSGIGQPHQEDPLGFRRDCGKQIQRTVDQ